MLPQNDVALDNNSKNTFLAIAITSIQFKDDGSFDFDLDPNENLEDLADILDIDIEYFNKYKII